MEDKSLNANVNSILKSFGVAAVSEMDRVELILNNILSQKSIKAKMLSLRYGKIILEADALNARLLSFDKNSILDRLNEEAGDLVTSISVKVKR